MVALASLTLATAALGTPVAAQDAPSGGTIVLGDWQAASQLNTFFTTAFTNVQAYTPAFRALYTVNNQGEWAGDLGTDIPSIENGMLVPDEDGDGFTVTLQLKTRAAMSDGTPLTMNDWKFTYEQAITWGKSGVGCSACGADAPPDRPDPGG